MNISITILLAILICLAFAVDSFAQVGGDEFVSLAGQFATKLPQNYLDYKPVVAYEVNARQFNGGLYKWQLGQETASIMFASTESILEKSEISDSFLKSIRDDYLKRLHATSTIGEKETSLDAHPGLISVLQTGAGRLMCWVYLFKNRFYLLSLTINDATKIEENINLLSSFRLASAADLEPRYAKLIEAMTPAPLSQVPPPGVTMNDLQNQHLNGKVRRIVTEAELYFENAPSTVKSLVSDENFSEDGNLLKGVTFRAGLPDAVRVYGYLEGERGYREQRKAPTTAFVSSDQKKPAEIERVNNGSSLNQTFKFKDKYGPNGALTEVHTIRADGQELEKFGYAPGKIEHSFYPLSEDLNFKKPLESDRVKDVDILDVAGNVIERTRTRRDADLVEFRSIDGKVQQVSSERYKTETFKFHYELDDKGNWTRRVTILVQKKRDSITEIPQLITYRTITYF